MNKAIRRAVLAAALVAALGLTFGSNAVFAQSMQTTIAAPTSTALAATAAQPGSNYTTGGLVANPAGRLQAPLAGLRQLTVAEPNIIDTKNATDCKLDAATLRQSLVAALTAEGLPLSADTNAAPDRFIIKPEIATLKDGVVNCVSWVSLSIEQQRVLTDAGLPDSQKALAIEYWRRGALILTPVVDHATGASDVLQRLAHVLARQWRIDNPAAGGIQAPAAATPAQTLQDLKR